MTMSVWAQCQFLVSEIIQRVVPKTGFMTIEFFWEALLLGR